MVLASVHCLPDTDAMVEGMCGDQLDEYTKPVWPVRVIKQVQATGSH